MLIHSKADGGGPTNVWIYIFCGVVIMLYGYSKFSLSSDTMSNATWASIIGGEDDSHIITKILFTSKSGVVGGSDHTADLGYDIMKKNVLLLVDFKRRRSRRCPSDGRDDQDIVALWSKTAEASS